MSGKTRNPTRRCKICGAKCEKVMRYCAVCAAERKAARGGAYFTPPATLAVVEREVAADIVTMKPPLSTGGYLGEPLPIVKGGAK